MPRFFIEDILPPDQTELKLTGAEAHHVSHVLRMREGDELLICDGSGSDFLCRIDRKSGHEVFLSIKERYANQTEPDYEVTLYQGLVKGEKMGQIIQKSVELGVTRIVPIQCQRSIVKVSDEYEKKQARWNRIAAEAAKQCGRGIRPPVDGILTFSDCIRDAVSADLSIIPWEMERKQSIRSVLMAFHSDFTKRLTADQNMKRANPCFCVMIGPEGGFTEEEVEEASSAGICPVTLGRRILRTETAGPAVLAMILYQFDSF
ncbi:MAG: 16S rRNA (uracil(1498)-N(3))-methyltransferase [Clostridia bacterium]|nr:16S rRNA (uracil(1498)-N(3))-methyltransferase [Clostridia bacterium]